jgi:aminopeptidase YwaD
VDNIEPTKIKRSAFIAAASGYYLATMPDRGESLVALSYANAHARLAEDGRRAVAMARDRTHTRDAAIVVSQGVLREQRRLQSITRFLRLDASAQLDRLKTGLADTGKAMLLTFLPVGDAEQLARAGFHQPAVDTRVPVRDRAVKGPLAPGGDWVREKAAGASVSMAIAGVPNSDDVTYEIVNFVDGARTVSEIRDAVSAEFEPLPLQAVAEYLELLARAGAISFKP